MSSLEDGFGGGVDDIVSANTGELRNLFWECALRVPRGTPFYASRGRVLFCSLTVQICKWHKTYSARSYSPDWSSRTTVHDGHRYDMSLPPLRLYPMCSV